MSRAFSVTATGLLCLFLLSGCIVSPANIMSSASANTAAAIGLDIPESFVVQRGLETRQVYNRGFPTFTTTVPAGQYRAQPGMTKFGSVYYKANRPVSLRIDRGNESREIETTGYLVFQERDFRKGEFDPTNLKFFVKHTVESRDLVVDVIETMRRFASLVPAGLGVESAGTARETPPETTDIFLEFRVSHDRHIEYQGTDRKERTSFNGNRIAITFPPANGNWN